MAMFDQGVMEIIRFSSLDRINWRCYHTFIAEDFNGKLVRFLD